MTKAEMINQLIIWHQDEEDLKTMSIEEIKSLYKELYKEFEGRPTYLYPNIDTEEDYEEAMDDAFSRFVDN